MNKMKQHEKSIKSLEKTVDLLMNDIQYLFEENKCNQEKKFWLCSCCVKMSEALENHTIRWDDNSCKKMGIFLGNLVIGHAMYKTRIVFCPFCGKKINTGEWFSKEYKK